MSKLTSKHCWKRNKHCNLHMRKNKKTFSQDEHCKTPQSSPLCQRRWWRHTYHTTHKQARGWPCSTPGRALRRWQWQRSPHQTGSTPAAVVQHAGSGCPWHWSYEQQSAASHVTGLAASKTSTKWPIHCLPQKRKPHLLRDGVVWVDEILPERNTWWEERSALEHPCLDR